jgi:dTDP-4-dehydrorhamnose 3,5-epimerase
VNFERLRIEGSWLIHPELVVDERGIFRRHFCAREFAEHGIDSTVKQGNVSENPHQFTLRGFHYQRAPFGEGKTLSCVVGRIFNILVDIREGSPTFRQWISLELNAEDRQSLFVPSGCANAYLTMEANTVVHYYMTEFYQPNAYHGFRYDDPSFGFDWPAQPKYISDKDRLLPLFGAPLTSEQLP